MNYIIKDHFNKILQADVNAVKDYSKNLISIVRVGKDPETLNSDGMKLLMTQVMSNVPFDNAKILVNRATETNGVLTIKSSFAAFLSYTCIVENEKIIATTLYIYQPIKTLDFNTVFIPKSKEANRMFRKHVRAMFSISANVITKDYAENGVVITNMAKDICNGKHQIYEFCDSLMTNCWRIIKKMSFRGISSIRWKVHSAGDGLLLFTIEAPKMGMIMTETYYIQNGKIQFECSIADGAMIDLVHELL